MGVYQICTELYTSNPNIVYSYLFDLFYNNIYINK